MSREIRSPVYQIDFTAVDAGKRISSSKRRIRWRFGFTNQDALAAGESGTACRGEEHDITLIWSLTSGKRLVLADGQEVHYSNSRAQVFDFSWTMRGNHVLKVVAHATTPMNVHPGFRQYDFFVDGMSFFSMPKVYRLGLTGGENVQDPGTLALAHSSRNGNYGNYSVGGRNPYVQSRGVNGTSPTTNGRGPSSIVEIEAPTNEQEEEAYLREAIKASLSDQQDGGRPTSSASLNAPPPPPPKEEDDLLIDFMSEPGVGPSGAFANPNPNPVQHNSFAMVQAVPVAAAPLAAVYALPPQQSSVASASQITHDPFLSPPVPQQQFNAAPTPFPPPPPPPPAPIAYNAAPTPPPPSFTAAPQPLPPVPVEQAPEAAPILTMAPQAAGLGLDANAAYEKFASMDQFDLVKPKANENRSNPFDDPIAAPAPVTSLADMKAKNHGNGEKKEVMKNSSMVVAQQQGGNWGGYSNYGMQVPPTPPPGQYGMPPTMGAQPPIQQQVPTQHVPQYGAPYGGGHPQQQQQQPMQYGGMDMQGGQQYQQPTQGYGQPQQPF